MRKPARRPTSSCQLKPRSMASTHARVRGASQPALCTFAAPLTPLSAGPPRRTAPQPAGSPRQAARTHTHGEKGRFSDNHVAPTQGVHRHPKWGVPQSILDEATQRKKAARNALNIVGSAAGTGRRGTTPRGRENDTIHVKVKVLSLSEERHLNQINTANNATRHLP